MAKSVSGCLKHLKLSFSPPFVKVVYHLVFYSCFTAKLSSVGSSCRMIDTVCDFTVLATFAVRRL
ncbi:MAG: hypothetical protein IJM09_06070 [Neisseriaceae bacterium]|nr:hypothetical protein [Neisseriaceae bacterium]